MDMWWWWSSYKLEKEERKNKKAQGKGIIDRSLLFWHSRHQVGVSVFRIDSRTIKRGETRHEIRLSKCHWRSNSLHMYLDSSEC
jgi:hypothetical protein